MPLRFVVAVILLFPTLAFAQADPLPSWNDGAAKQAIVAFVAKVTKQGSPDFVPRPERIATFDNDGTLWCEQPMYVQIAFALDRVKALAPQASRVEEQAAVQGDARRRLQGAALAPARRAWCELIAATHAGMTTEEFERIVRDWIATARHPKFKRPYTEMVYQPMLELLAYLRANGFKTFIVSGGGVEFMRPWTEKVYGIPPEQVVGSSGKLEVRAARRQARADASCRGRLVDDGPASRSASSKFIGRRPIVAFGNSDGDSADAAMDRRPAAGARFG